MSPWTHLWLNKLLRPLRKYQKTIYTPPKNVETGLYPSKKGENGLSPPKKMWAPPPSLVFKEWGIWTSLHTNFQTLNFIFMNMKQDIYKNLQKFLHSHLQFSSIFRNYLPETKVFSSSVPQENPPLGPFHLFSEQVPVCGKIWIGLFQWSHENCRKLVWFT